MSDFLAASDLTDVYAGPVQILAGDEPSLATKSETLTSGSNLTAGVVLARTTSSGKLVQYNPAGSGGANIAVGVLVSDCNATSADTVCSIYVSGCFNTAWLQFNGASAAQILGIFDATKLLHKPLNWSAG